MDHFMATKGNENIATQDAYVKSYWEQPEIWIEELNELDTVRIPRTISMIPDDVATVLEIGCGNGRLINQISEKYKTIGLDISRTALHFVKGGRVAGRCNVLPFRAQSADLVICADVLEHLPEEMLRLAVDELKRVSKRYVMIGVPFKERFEGAYVKCTACAHIFNQFGHLRSFKCSTLDRLFPDLQLVNTEFVGQPRKYLNRFLMLAWQRMGEAYGSDARKGILCPKCGHKQTRSIRQNFMQKSVAKCCFMANELLDKMIPSRMRPQSEIIRLYRKS